MSDKIKIGVIVGPTAVGKTAAAVECALRLNAEIISADSIQIYRELDIGSAKPTREEMRGVVHHLVDFYGVDDEKFSVAEFQRRAGSCIRDIAQRGRFPLVAGGTGLYVNSLVYPLDFTATPPPPKVCIPMNASGSSVRWRSKRIRAAISGTILLTRPSGISPMNR